MKMKQKYFCFILCLAFIMTLVGCGEQKDIISTTEQSSSNDFIQQDVTTSTQLSSVEEQTDTDGSNNHYVIYGDIEIDLPIDIDDYMSVDDNGRPMFMLAHLAKEYGWTFLGDGSNTFFYNTPNYKLKFEYYGVQYWDSEDPVFGKASPIHGFSYVFATKDDGTINERYTDEGRPLLQEEIDEVYKGITATNLDHDTLANCIAVLAPSSPSLAISKDLLVVFAYLLTTEYRDLGDNPFYRNEGLYKFKTINSNNKNREYRLPIPPKSSTNSKDETPEKEDSGYHYTIYGNIDITLPINIDDYVVNPGQPSFLLEKLAEEYGWQMRGEETNIFTYDKSSDFRITFRYEGLDGRFEDPVFDTSVPVQTLYFNFGGTDEGKIDERYGTSVEPEDLYKSMTIYNSDVSSTKDCYACLAPSNPSMAASKDLIVLIAYMITSDYRITGENPFCHVDGLMAHNIPSQATFDTLIFNFP